jgi:hypothetical protein
MTVEPGQVAFYPIIDAMEEFKLNMQHERGLSRGDDRERPYGR